MNLCSLKVEAGQLEVKQNLVKFNNFVREKQGKVVNNMISTQRRERLLSVCFVTECKARLLII